MFESVIEELNQSHVSVTCLCDNCFAGFDFSAIDAISNSLAFCFRVFSTVRFLYQFFCYSVIMLINKICS